MDTNTVKLILTITGYFFIFYLLGYATFLILSVIIGPVTLYNRRHLEKYKNILTHDYYVPITIIVPAYNEEITVVETVISLLDLDYKLYEIVVVDDGSKDKTAEVLVKYFDLHKIERPIYQQIKCKKEKAIYSNTINGVSVILVSKENGGKADALNMGINISKYPYFLCMDADSFLQRDSLKNIAKPLLENDLIIACGGLVAISNDVQFENGYVKKYTMPKNSLVCMQILEYDRSFLASRILLDKFNGNLIISGAFGLFKKDAVITVGGYDSGTIGEDMELVVKLHVFCRSHEQKYIIRYAPDAVCWSQAPSTLRDLIKQRRRWYIGLFQTMMKYKNLFANYKYGIISFISFLYFLLYELLSPFIEIFGIVTVVISYVYDLINVKYMISLFFIYALYGAILSLTAFFSRCHTLNYKFNFKDIIKAIALCLFEIIVLRFVMSFVRMTSLFKYKKRKSSWGSITRTKNKVSE